MFENNAVLSSVTVPYTHFVPFAAKPSWKILLILFHSTTYQCFNFIFVN
jgi:hypothetical protein